MKALIPALILISMSTQAFAERRAPYAKLDDINWSKRGTLEQSFLAMCDDSYYSGFKIIVPGRLGRNFKVVLDVNTGWLLSNIRRADKGQIRQTELTVEAGDDSGEQMIIQEILPNGEPGQTATIELNDAC